MDYSSKLNIRLSDIGEELLEMTDEERNATIQEFKMEILPPDKLKILEFLEGVVDTESYETGSIETEE